MKFWRSRRSRPRSTLVAACLAAAGAGLGCSAESSSYGTSGFDPDGRARAPEPWAPPAACPPLVNLTLRATVDAIAAGAGADPSALSVRLCVDSSCEDVPLLSGRPSREGDAPALTFDLPLDGADARASTHLAAVSVSAPGGRAPLFAAAREFSLGGEAACRGSVCSSCVPTTSLVFDVTLAAKPPEPCGGELVASVRAREALELASPTLFAEVCVDAFCHEAPVSFAASAVAAGESVDVVVPLGGRFGGPSERVVKLSLGYEPGAPVYSDARLLALDGAALGCDAAAAPDVVFELRAGALPAPEGDTPAPPPRPGPAGQVAASAGR